MIGKFVVIDTLDNFKSKLSSIPSSAIVLIKDVGQIYAHGTYFGARNTCELLNQEAAGLAPAGGINANGQISNVDSEWVLTVTEGKDPAWKKLPANAFANNSEGLKAATDSALGGIKVGSVYNGLFSTLTGKHYTVNIDSDGLAYVSVPWSFTDQNVKQTVTSLLNEDFRLLFSHTADDTTRTEGARKASNLKFNPSTGTLTTTILKGNLDGNYINKLTGYNKAKSVAAITTSDTLNTALGKLEHKADVVYDLVDASKPDSTTIDTLQEVLSVLSGITDTQTVQGILGNYLLLAGGTMKGDITFTKPSGKTTTYAIDFFEGVHRYLFTENNVLKYGVAPNANTILHSGNYSSYALPLSGGRLSGSGADLFQINRTDGNPVISYYHNGSWLGRIGYNTNGSPVAQIGDDYQFLLHSGNIGSYNAGSATKLQTARSLWGNSFDGSSDLSGDIIISKTTNSSVSGGKIILRGYYSAESANWDAIIASDYYGANYCSEAGFSHGMIFKGGRSGFDSFIFIDSSSNPVARISKVFSNYFKNNTEIEGTLSVTGNITMSSGIATNWSDTSVDSNNKARPWYGLSYSDVTNANNMMLSGYYGITYRTGSTAMNHVFKGGHVRPDTNSTQTLGTSSYKWNNVYSTTFTGNLNGNITKGTPQLCSAVESDEITIKESNNGSITTNAPTTSAGLRKAIDFRWYDTHWRIGNIRGSGSNTDGFGITHGANNLCFRVTTDGCYANGSKILTEANANLGNADTVDNYHIVVTSSPGTNTSTIYFVT